MFWAGMIAYDGRTGIYDNFTRFIDGQLEQIQGARRGLVEHIPIPGEFRAMTGADKFSAAMVKWHSTTQMRAAAVDRQKAAIIQAYQVKAPGLHRSNATLWILVVGAKIELAAKFACSRAW